MKNLIAAAIILAALITALVMVNTEAVAKAKKADKVHLIVFAQDADTEAEFTVDGEKHTEELDAGVTYLSYSVKDPDVSVLAYGDKFTPRVDKGRDGEYYTIIYLQPPGESVGE